MTYERGVQSVFEDYSGTCEVGLRYEEKAAWAAFQGLMSSGILIHSASGRIESRAVPPKRRTVSLTVSADEIRRGIDGHPECPGVLMDLMAAPAAAALTGMGVDYTER